MRTRKTLKKRDVHQNVISGRECEKCYIPSPLESVVQGYQGSPNIRLWGRRVTGYPPSDGNSHSIESIFGYELEVIFHYVRVVMFLPEIPLKTYFDAFT